MSATLFCGLMSGTSMDGVDAVLAQFSPKGLCVLGHHHQAFSTDLRAELLALNQPGDNELHRAALAANQVSRLYAQAVEDVLQACGVQASQVAALGAHGQTVRHRPGEFDGAGYTLQLLNGALLAELSGIDVVCDFRSRDVAAGGQGAPLVPAFHAAVFALPGVNHAVLNLGGIGNLTVLSADGAVTGFDCGPGNALLDLWCQQHLGQDFDRNGAWAAQGQVQEGLLQALLAEPFLQRAPPKSTGRDLFNAPWLAQRLAEAADLGQASSGVVAAGHGQLLAPVDVQATLAEFTARAACDALHGHQAQPHRLLVCGGGALNGHLMARLQALLPGTVVSGTDQAGLPPMQVEAAAFAWLAHAHVAGQAGNLPGVTGAQGLRRLGALYPAGVRTAQA